jgi:hypothetical protein
MVARGFLQELLGSPAGTLVKSKVNGILRFSQFRSAYKAINKASHRLTVPVAAQKVVPVKPRMSARAPVPTAAKVFAGSLMVVTCKARVKLTSGKEEFPRGDVVAEFEDFRKSKTPNLYF